MIKPIFNDIYRANSLNTSEKNKNAVRTYKNDMSSKTTNSISNIYYAPFSISFGKNKKQVNIDSRSYCLKNHYPSYKKVPDGFKFAQSKKIYAPEAITKKGTLGADYDSENEQVTLIDRNKDITFQEIKNKYDLEMIDWQKQLNKTKGLTKSDRHEFLILNTVDYVRSLKNSEFMDDLANENDIADDLDGRQSYLGEVFALGENVCRHNSFMTKLLLEDYNVPVGIQAGYIISEYGSGYHVWNTYTDKNDVTTTYDASFPNRDCWYFNYDGDSLYTDNLTKERQTLFDVVSMQVGDEIMLGFDEKNDVVTDKMDKNAKFFARLKLEEPDQMHISSPNQNDEGPYDYTLDEKNNVVFYNKDNNEKVFEFPYANLSYFLKVRMTSDCIKLSKILNLPMKNGIINYPEIIKNKQLIKSVDPFINQEMLDSLPEIIGIEQN